MIDREDYKDILKVRSQLQNTLRELERADSQIRNLREMLKVSRAETRVYSERVVALEREVTALIGPRSRRAMGGIREGYCISFWGVKSSMGPDDIFRRFECPDTVLLHQSEEMLSRAYAEFEREGYPFPEVLGWNRKGYPGRRPADVGYWNAERLLKGEL